jgi:4,5-dihydroxyphthalate decarboxylase
MNVHRNDLAAATTDAVSRVAPARDATSLPLTIAFGDYDRTRPLLDGRVVPAGVAPTYKTEWIGHFCTRPVYEEYDVAEMSMSWYLAARCRGEPVIALPVFPLRMPVHAYMFCRADAPYTSPRDLAGKRIGVMLYRLTVNLWLRGIIQDVYGVKPEQMSWVTSGPEGAEYVVPKSIDLTVNPGIEAEKLLLSGEVDAVFLPEIPSLFENGDPRIRRLFPDAQGELEAYYAATNIVPITHTLVMGEALYRKSPWVAESMVHAFRAAQRAADQDSLQPKYFSFLEAAFMMERQRRVFGKELYQHGLAANRHIIETFVRYANEQGYIDRRPAVDELFAENTLTL